MSLFTKNKKVLIIDDEPELVEIYSESLKNAGYSVIIAGNGADGLKLARSEKPDLILLDLKMPQMPGLEVMAKIKEDPTLKDLKVVFLTAFSDPLLPAIDTPYAQYAGAKDLIKKGVGLDEFISKVKSYIG